MTSHKIEDYALLGDTRTAALVSKDGSVDWLCAPRFDSPACFAALLGSAEHGRWLLAPTALPHVIKRRYRDDTLVLETDYETDGGSVRVIDTMAPVPAGQTVTLVRIVEGRSGHVSMRMDLTIRFGYGLLAPWLQRVGDDLLAVSGPDALRLSTPIDVADHGGRAGAEFVLATRRDLHPCRTSRRWLLGGGARLARLAASCGRRRSGQDADRLWARR